MGVIYVVSAVEGAGKTTVCAGLAANLLESGKKAGYLNPQAAEKSSADGDISFMKRILGLTDVVNAPDMKEGRDVVLIEAMLGPTPGDARSQQTYGAAREMQARTIVVESYLDRQDSLTEVYKGFGDSLLGVILNKVPASQFKRVGEEAAARFEAAGIKLLGALPEDRLLLSITVGELAGIIEGKILNNPEKSPALVENYMLGAMIVDSGLDYFGRKTDKAAVVHADRPDMQLAALETPTRCLVLSGGGPAPMYNVMQKAEGRGIPVIVTDFTTPDIIDRIEKALAESRLDQDMKVKQLAGIVKQNVDIKAII